MPATPFFILQIARVVHEANRAWCVVNGDDSQSEWVAAPEWQRTSAIQGVTFHLSNPNASASASHENWLKHKAAEGWTYGEVKDPDKKTHPCIVPFDRLPPRAAGQRPPVPRHRARARGNLRWKDNYAKGALRGMTNKCRWCGMFHGYLCPAVRSFEFFDDGVTVKRVEFHPPPSPTPIPFTC